MRQGSTVFVMRTGGFGVLGERAQLPLDRRLAIRPQSNLRERPGVSDLAHRDHIVAVADIADLDRV